MKKRIVLFTIIGLILCISLGLASGESQGSDIPPIKLSGAKNITIKVGETFAVDKNAFAFEPANATLNGKNYEDEELAFYWYGYNYIFIDRSENIDGVNFRALVPGYYGIYAYVEDPQTGNQVQSDPFLLTVLNEDGSYPEKTEFYLTIYPVPSATIGEKIQINWLIGGYVGIKPKDAVITVEKDGELFQTLYYDDENQNDSFIVDSYGHFKVTCSMTDALGRAASDTITFNVEEAKSLEIYGLTLTANGSNLNWAADYHYGIGTKTTDIYIMDAAAGELYMKSEPVKEGFYGSWAEHKIPSGIYYIRMNIRDDEGDHWVESNVCAVEMEMNDGFIAMGDKWYYVIHNEFATGWVMDQDNWYYMNSLGQMVTGWQKINDEFYYFLESGEMKTGWLQEGDAWYYLKPSGAMATGSLTINGEVFVFDADGAWMETAEKQTGWAEEAGSWVYYDENGQKKAGWLNAGGSWYYLDENGVMQVGWQNVNGVWYFFSNSGAMQTGWNQIGGIWYYMNEDGAMSTGWKQIGSTWYYMDESGEMATGWRQIGGTWYNFMSSGAMRTRGWMQEGDTWYYFDYSGAMLTGYQVIDGTNYLFSSSGAWIE